MIIILLEYLSHIIEREKLCGSLYIIAACDVNDCNLFRFIISLFFLFSSIKCLYKHSTNDDCRRQWTSFACLLLRSRRSWIFRTLGLHNKFDALALTIELSMFVLSMHKHREACEILGCHHHESMSQERRMREQHTKNETNDFVA